GLQAEVRPGRAGRERHVHTVVHDHRHRERADERAGQRQNLAGRCIFQAHLDDGGPFPARRGSAAHLDRIGPLEKPRVRDHHQAQLTTSCHEQNPAWTARRDHRRGEHRRGDPGRDGRAVARAPGRERLPARGGRERHLHVIPGPHRGVPRARRAPARLERCASARRGGGRGARRRAALYPRPAPLLHREAAARAETYVSAGRGQAAPGPEEMTDSRTVGRADGGVATRAVIVSAKGAARWQAGHPWIYRTDLYDEPRETPGVASVTDRRGRHLGQALYSPTSEIRLRLLTTGREPIDATWWADRITAAVRRPAGIPATAYRVVHGEGDGLPSLVVDRYGPYVVAHLLSAGLEQVRADGVMAVDSGADALARGRENAALNELTNITWREANAFDLLRELERREELFDTIVLDPPAFAKSKQSVPRALAGYKEINLRAM